MSAFRPYRSDKDEKLLWEWIARQIERDLDQMLRAYVHQRLQNFSRMSPRETQELLWEAGAMNPRRVREQIVDDVRRRFWVYEKHKPGLELHGGGREQALRMAIASAIYATAAGILLQDNLIGKVDYYISSEIPPGHDEVCLDGIEGAGLRDVLPDQRDEYSGVENSVWVEQVIARAKLSKNEREVVTHYRADLKRGEVAQRTGRRPKTVDEERRRAVRKLRDAS